jgi:hypothetical protein
MKIKDEFELTYEPTDHFVVIYKLHGDKCKACSRAAKRAEDGARSSGSLGCTEFVHKRFRGKEVLAHSAQVKRAFVAGRVIKAGGKKNDG